MASDRLKKYIWIIDTINQHGKISRAELSRLWQKSSQGDGNPIPHRTFFSYRRSIERELGVIIKCNNANEYFIDSSDTMQSDAFRNWIVDSYAMRSLLDDSREIADRIHVEPVPSARQYLSSVLEAIRSHRRILFSYASFSRPKPEQDIGFEPHFVKLFRQRWYMVGVRVSDGELRTYALDRITQMSITHTMFNMPEQPTAKEYFADLFGITQSHAPATHIKIKVNLRTTKYIRALPLHGSQWEEPFSDFSIFHYDMKLTDDLVRHLLSMGSDIEVLEPRALRLMIVQNLKETLAHYEQ